MVTRLFLNLLLSLWLTPLTYAQFSVELDKTQSRLGEPLLLRIASSASLNELDLSRVTQDFEIFSQTTNSSGSPGHEQYILDVTLYPLHSGKLVLPSLSLGAMHSRSVPVHIQPSNVALIAWVPPEIPMEREPTLLHLEIRDDGSLTWDTPIEVDAPSATLHALPELNRQERQANVTQFVHHYRWRVLPLKAGSLRMSFGMLDAHKFGQRLRFPVNAVSLRVQAAPAYLPLHLPVGKPAIRTDTPPRQIISGQPVAWNVYIHAPGLSAEGALSLLQYTAPQGLHFYAPSVTPVSIDGVDTLRLTLTFVGERTAEIFPALHLPYFDIQKQRIELLTLPATSLKVSDPLHENMITGALMLVGGLLLAGLGYKVWPRFQQLWIKRAWLARMRATQDPTNLYRVLTQASPWRTATLRQCPELLQTERALCKQLEQVRFGAQSSDIPFADLKHAWTRACARIPLVHFKNRRVSDKRSCIPT